MHKEHKTIRMCFCNIIIVGSKSWWSTYFIWKFKVDVVLCQVMQLKQQHQMMSIIQRFIFNTLTMSHIHSQRITKELTKVLLIRDLLVLVEIKMSSFPFFIHCSFSIRFYYLQFFSTTIHHWRNWPSHYM